MTSSEETNELTDKSESTAESTSTSKPSTPPVFTVVGIGASAGGLESLESFFKNVSVDSGMAYIVIQHLSPDFKSMMVELLARHTDIPIYRAEEGMTVQRDTIYLLPPQKEMIISGNKLHLTDKDPSQGFTLPIDHFFRSLAQDCGENAIAIVMSGTGSDGSRGIVEVHNAGGLAVTENAETAKFDGMPLAAKQTGIVDFVLQCDEMPAALLEHVYEPSKVKKRLSVASVVPPEGIEAVFELLKQEHDIDFSHYKPTTVGRRIERRLLMNRIRDLDEYVARLRDDPAELNLLYKDLLIGVTKFFRDTDPFQMLEREVIPELLKNVPPGNDIRIWCAGCATGEEPYSIAIMLHEALEKANRPINVKIFATDVHQASLDVAGHGVFDEDRLVECSKHRLKRFFTKKGNQYQISTQIRKLIVFAQHNSIKDAPFTNLDLISCRNLLIYFLPPAQKKAISLFHFGLKTQGVLLLGSSESPGELSDEFETINEHCKFYRKKRDVRLPTEIQVPVPKGTHVLGRNHTQRSSRRRPDQRLIETYDSLLDKFMPPSLLVDASRNLIDSFGGAEKFLRVKGRRPSTDLLDMLDTEAKTSIAGALNRVLKSKQKLSFTGITLRTPAGENTYKLSIEPMGNPKTGDQHYLICFNPIEQPIVREPIANVNVAEMSRDQVQYLEEQLNYTKENLQASVEELETSNEEMQATNEEMVASNEELQSTNEELHSVNEELYTVNAEHQKKIGELDELNQDMEHLLQSTDVATIFLDQELCIRKFTPNVSECFDLIDSDIGRRIDTFSHRIRYENLLQDLWRVLDDGNSKEIEVSDVNDRSYFLRMLPYRPMEGRIEGVVLSLVDITVLTEARGQIQALSAIVESSRDAITSCTLEGVITTWNDAAQSLYGYSADEAVGKDIYMLVPDDQIEHAMAKFDQVRNDVPIKPCEVTRLTKDKKMVHVSMMISPINDPGGKIVGVSSITRDISELKHARKERADSDRRTRLLLESSAEAIYGLDRDGKCTFVNPACVDLLGYDSADDLLGQPMHSLIHHTLPDGTACDYEACAMSRPLRDSKRVLLDEVLLWRQDGTSFHGELSSHPIVDESDQTVGAVVTFHDITDRIVTTRRLRLEIDRREQFLAMLSHELRNPLSAVRTATRILNAKNASPDVEVNSRSVIDRQTAHMTMLLDDLLDVSRITQDKIVLNREVVDLVTTIEDAVQSVQTTANDREIEIRIDTPAEQLSVDGDATRLQQIHANLLTNAIKYSARGQQVQISLSQEGNHAVIRMTDQGVGIPRELLGGEIFEMFFQSDDTLDRAQGGMGVGLTLVRKLVELHGGTVKASSDGIGTGSQFEVRLPLASGGVGTSVEGSGLSHSTKKVERIVILEDQHDNREMVSSLLQIEGFNVEAAADGLAGFHLIQQVKPDVAIVDIGLPELDGFEVAKRVRADKELSSLTKPLVLIALTGYGQPQDIEFAHECGFDYHMVKPLQPERLLEILGSL